MPHDAPDGSLRYVISGKGADFPMSDGLAGGYPGEAKTLLEELSRPLRLQGDTRNYFSTMANAGIPARCALLPLRPESGESDPDV